MRSIAAPSSPPSRGVGTNLREFSGQAEGSFHLWVDTVSVSCLTLFRCGRVCGQREPV